MDPDVVDESDLVGSREGDLVRLFETAELTGIEAGVLTVRRHFDDVDDWWLPFTLGVGPAGAYAASLDDAGREALRSACAEILPPPPFELAASAWYATGRVAR